MAPLSQDIIEEKSQHIFSLYERKSKSFRSALVSVSGLLAMMFVLIFYPYVRFRGERYTLEAEFKDLERNVASVEARFQEYEDLIRRFYDHKESAYETIWGSNFEGLEGVTVDHRERLTALVDSLHNEISDRFAYKRISHLRNELFVPLYDSLTKLHNDFRAWLLGTAPGWEADGVEVKGSLRDHYRLFLETYIERIEEHYYAIHRSRDSTGAELSSLERQKKETETELKSVISRLEEMKNLREIQTPFGQLPVGLNDLVLLFPVLTAAGFMLMASLFRETLRLRLAYHQLCRLRDPDQEIFDNSHIALVAPVWIDPLQPIMHRAYRLLILSVPVMIFVTAIILLLSNRLMWGSFMAEVRLSSTIYATFYVVSGLAIVEGGRRIYGALNMPDGNA